MNEQRYGVLLDGTNVAEDMPLDIALILAKGIFDEYHAQAAQIGMTVSIRATAQWDEHG